MDSLNKDIIAFLPGACTVTHTGATVRHVTHTVLALDEPTNDKKKEKPVPTKKKIIGPVKAQEGHRHLEGRWCQ